MTETASPTTLSFLALPEDIQSAVDDLAGQDRPLSWMEIKLLVGTAIAKERERAKRLELAVEFAARWAWREDPPNASRKLTDAERLSAIKYHPTIKATWERGE